MVIWSWEAGWSRRTVDPLWRVLLRRSILLHAVTGVAFFVLLAAGTSEGPVFPVVGSAQNVVRSSQPVARDSPMTPSPVPPVTPASESLRSVADRRSAADVAGTPDALEPPLADEIDHLILFPSGSSPTNVAYPNDRPTRSVLPSAPTPRSGPPTRQISRPAPPVIPRRPPGLEKIQHFVFIMQENRSFDSYFGTYPGADGIRRGVCLENPAGGPCVAPYHDTSDVNRGGPHDLADALADINHGRMDGFVARAYVEKVKNGTASCPPTWEKCPSGEDPRDVMGWHDYHEIPNYWNYARLYVLQDHMFSSAASFTLPNRLYLLSGQSGGYVTHGQPQPSEYRFPEITGALSRHHIDWKYYVTSGTQPSTGDGRVVGSATEQALHPHQSTYFNPLPSFSSVRSDPDQQRRIVDTAQFYGDARAGHLPSVCWVVPTEEVSEHPPYSIRVGMAYVTGLINAVMEGPDWSTTAIFISYDEWGGFYDHVPPARVDEYGLGIRVPGLVISPYARQGFVDHEVHSPASWLRVVEERFGLEPLTARDAAADDMIEAFDFTQKPRPPVILSATTQGSPYPHPLQTIQREK